MEQIPKPADFFPFPEIRPVQEEALSVIEKAHAAGKKFVVLEVPTGGGKSGIAVAAAQWAKAVLGGGTYILSPQKTLTSQYIQDFAKIGLRELKGRNSYECREFGTDCERGAVLRRGDRDLCQHCPYRLAKDDFISSPFGVTNFSYYLSEMGYAGELGRRSLLILDEGHNIETALSGETDVQITRRQQSQYGIQSTPKTSAAAEYRRWAAEVVYKAIDSYIQEEQKIDYPTPDERIASSVKITSARKMLLRLGRFVNSEKLDHWVTWTDEEGTVIIRPLTPKLHTGRMLFDHADMIIIMSATILDLKTFTRNLGIAEDQCEFLSLPSDFEKENREIYYTPVGSMTYNHQLETLPRLAEFVRKVLSQFHPKEKGIVHTHTYKINDFLVEALRGEFGNRIITHNSFKQRDQAVGTHCSSSRPTVLLSPGMAEGLDLKGPLSRFQIICKVPYPYLDQYTRARMKSDPLWYSWRTALTLVQATGRSVRSKEDYAITYVADSEFEPFIARNTAHLPKWWLDAIRWPKKKGAMVTATPSDEKQQAITNRLFKE